MGKLKHKLVVAVVFAALVMGALPVGAQDGADGSALYVLNLRAGPGASFAVVGELQPGTGMVFEARNEDMSWLLGHTVDGARRGWVASLYFSYAPGFAAVRLPVSDQIIAAPAAPEAPVSAAAAPPAAASNALDLAAFVPAISPRVREIFLRGQTLGNNPNIFTKVGDCNSNSGLYLGHVIGAGQYDLGQYGYVQAAIDHFAPSFMAVNTATSPGFNIAMVLDATYADPQVCGGQSPLGCDFERLHPSVVFINQNMGDVMALDVDTYRSSLRYTIDYAIDNGVIPVLVTFPLYTRAWEVNYVMRSLAAEYDVPLVDFSGAADALPNRGMEVVGEGIPIHLTGREFIDFNGDQNVYGFTLLDLLTLQTLERLRAVMY